MGSYPQVFSSIVQESTSWPDEERRMLITADVLALLSAYEETFRSADWEPWGSLFEEDADFVTWRGVWWRSRTEIVRGHREADAWVQRQACNYLLKPLGARPIAAEMMIAHAAWEWGAFQPSASSLKEDRSGILTLVLATTAQGWRIQASHNTRAA
jgi:uncharacterized protein (TIGR02246 family)